MHTQAHRHGCAPKHKHTCIYKQVHVDTPMCVQTLHMCTHRHTCTYKQTHVSTRAHVHSRVPVHATHTHKHTVCTRTVKCCAEGLPRVCLETGSTVPWHSPLQRPLPAGLGPHPAYLSRQLCLLQPGSFHGCALPANSLGATCKAAAAEGEVLNPGILLQALFLVYICILKCLPEIGY